MTHAQFDINEVIDKMLTEHENLAACSAPQKAAIRYLVLRKNAVLMPSGHEIAHREREMVPGDIYDALVKDLELARGALNQTSDTAERMCLERNKALADLQSAQSSSDAYAQNAIDLMAQRNKAQDECRELAQRVDEQAKTIANLERQLFDRGRP